MVVDEEQQALYVYGGTDPAGELSGMFRYDIRQGQWHELLCAAVYLTFPCASCASILMAPRFGSGDNYLGLQSRTGHSMLWNAAKREIYIFGGLRSPN